MASDPFIVKVHPFPSPTTHSCAYELLLEPASPSAEQPRNALLFIGGLGDGPQTVPYIRHIASHLNSHPSLGYSVFETRLRSSFDSYGVCSLKDDVEDISALVKYVRSLGRKKIVLMGHSTGSQDCVAYAKDGTEPVDGFILQAPVSDRQALVSHGYIDQEELDESLAIAAEMIEEDRGDDLMPKEDLPACYTAPMTAYRFHSLSSKGGDDDLFSTDLSDDVAKAIWSRFTKPILIAPSEQDEYFAPGAGESYPEVIAKWKGFCNEGVASEISQPIPGANHAVHDEGAREELAKMVSKFLEGLA